MKPFDLFIQRWRAKLLLLVGLRSEAMAVCRAILEKMPEDAHALNSLAYDHLQSGHPALALPLFERAAQHAPGLSNSHFNVAFVNDELGNLAQAEREFRAAIAIEEKNGSCLVRIGPGFTQAATPRRGLGRAVAQHQTSAHEPARLVPNGAYSCGIEAAGRGGQIDSAFEGV